LGIGAAVVTAIYDIQLVCYSGPILSFSGMLITAVASVRQRPWAMYFGWTAPWLSVLTLAWIYSLGWSPQDAQIPVATFIALATVFVILPIAARATLESRRVARAAGTLPFQYSIRWLIAATVLVAVVVAGLRSIGPVDLTRNVMGLVVGTILISHGIATFVVLQVWISRSQPTQPASGGPPSNTADGPKLS
jgi:hypothetical protein